MSGSNNSTYPLDTVVYVTDTVGGEDYQASGVLIAPNIVLTAAHVVYDSRYGTATDIRVTPAYEDGSAPYGSALGEAVQYNSVDDANDTITNQQSQYDFAVIELGTSFSNIGTMSLEANFTGGAVDVTGYPGSADGALVNQAETVTLNSQYSLLDGTSIGPGSSGGPIWVSSSSGTPEVVGLVSSGDTRTGTGYFVQLTSADITEIDGWVSTDEASASSSSGLTVEDTTTDTALPGTAQAYPGPVTGVNDEFIDVTSDNLNITATTGGWFLHSGSGNDALTATSGTNVLDGGTGSNFLTGGSGTDTFFVDDRSATSAIWSTVVNFHSGDAATIWGIAPSTFDLVWDNNQGAGGYTGLTLHASASGEATASLTLAGYTRAALSDGALSVTYGTDPTSGSSYAYIYAA
jgi:V8-like Glu-specific endopeptidase